MNLRPIAKFLLPAATLGLASVALRGQITEGPLMPVMGGVPSAPDLSQVPGQPPNLSAAEPAPTESPFRYGPFVFEPGFILRYISMGPGSRPPRASPRI